MYESTWQDKTKGCDSCSSLLMLLRVCVWAEAVRCRPMVVLKLGCWQRSRWMEAERRLGVLKYWFRKPKHPRGPSAAFGQYMQKSVKVQSLHLCAALRCCNEKGWVGVSPLDFSSRGLLPLHFPLCQVTLRWDLLLTSLYTHSHRTIQRFTIGHFLELHASAGLTRYRSKADLSESTYVCV